MQTSYGCIFKNKTSVAAINITLGVPGQRADKSFALSSVGLYLLTSVATS